MIQIAIIALSVMLIIIGIKGFTPAGLQFSKNTNLVGTKGKIVGTLCILLGIGLIPLFTLLVLAFAS